MAAKTANTLFEHYRNDGHWKTIACNTPNKQPVQVYLSHAQSRKQQKLDGAVKPRLSLMWPSTAGSSTG